MAEDEAAARHRERVQREKDQVHRAIGRYIVEFSRVVVAMRENLIRIIAPNGIYWHAAGLAFGESSASQIAHAYFAMIDFATDGDDEKLLRGLERKVTKAIKTRNDLAHGDWWVGWAAPGEPMEEPFYERVKPARRSGPYELRKVAVDELDALSDALVTLCAYLSEIGAIRRGKHPLQRDAGKPHPSGIGEMPMPEVHLRDIFVLHKDGSITRDGPMAAEPFDAPNTAP